MKATDFTSTISVEQPPKVAFEAIQNLRGWWSETIEGNTNMLNELSYYHFEDAHRCTQKLTEKISNEKLVYLLMENYFSFTKDKTELTNTQLVFEISTQNNKTLIRFTHEGLVSTCECFEICSNAWITYVQESLFELITKGKGKPNGKGKPQSEDEKKFSSTNQ